MMNGAFSSLREHFRRMRVAYMVLALSLVPAAVVYYRVRANVMTREQTHFDRLAKQKEAAIAQRIPRYLDEMLGLRGLFAADGSVSSDQWQRYIASLDIQAVHPGLRSFGYLKRVNTGEEDSFSKLVGVGRPVIIRPEGVRSIYFPVLHLSQTETNSSPELGLDHYANPALRDFMDLARDTGLPRTTGRLDLTDGNGAGHSRPCLVIYLPVYQSGLPTLTPENRQSALQGFIFAVLESEKLLGGLFGDDQHALLDYQIYDGPDLSPEHLLRTSDPTASATPAGLHQLEQTTNDSFPDAACF